jgi:hypothetical protein
MRNIALLLFVILFTECSLQYRTISCITEYKYHVKSEDAWIDNRVDSTKLYWIKKHEKGIVKLLKIKKDYSDLYNKGYVIHKQSCQNKLDSILKDTICPYIRHVNLFHKDTTRYVFITLKAKVKKKEIMDIETLHFRMYIPKSCR